MKTIEVDYEKLTEHLVRSCSSLTVSVGGTWFCQKKMDATCRLSLYEREKCPRDCPHMNEKVEWACDEGRCPRVKAIIKKLKA